MLSNPTQTRMNPCESEGQVPVVLPLLQINHEGGRDCDYDKQNFPWSYVTHINGLSFCLQSKLDNRAILNRVIADIFQRTQIYYKSYWGLKVKRVDVPGKCSISHSPDNSVIIEHSRQ
jgi:hypothetical protein